MKSLIKKVFYIITLCGLISSTVSQEVKSQESRQNGSTDDIFKEIMQTLPQEKQNEIKSANQIMEQKELSGEEVEAVRNRMQERRNQAIDELPDEVKEKVEKTINETEKNMEERRLQLKELKQGNK